MVHLTNKPDNYSIPCTRSSNILLFLTVKVLFKAYRIKQLTRKCTGLSETSNYGVSMTTITIIDSLWRHNENCCYANMRSQGQAFVCWHLNLSVTCGTVVPRRWTCLSVILPYSTTILVYCQLEPKYQTSENSNQNSNIFIQDNAFAVQAKNFHGSPDIYPCKFVKSPIRHLGLAIRNVWRVQTFFTYNALENKIACENGGHLVLVAMWDCLSHCNFHNMSYKKGLTL